MDDGGFGPGSGGPPEGWDGGLFPPMVVDGVPLRPGERPDGDMGPVPGNPPFPAETGGGIPELGGVGESLGDGTYAGGAGSSGGYGGFLLLRLYHRGRQRRLVGGAHGFSKGKRGNLGLRNCQGVAGCLVDRTMWLIMARRGAKTNSPPAMILLSDISKPRVLLAQRLLAVTGS
jgi:hypothetical protein